MHVFECMVLHTSQLEVRRVCAEDSLSTTTCMEPHSSQLEVRRVCTEDTPSENGKEASVSSRL